MSISDLLDHDRLHVLRLSAEAPQERLGAVAEGHADGQGHRLSEEKAMKEKLLAFWHGFTNLLLILAMAAFIVIFFFALFVFFWICLKVIFFLTAVFLVICVSTAVVAELGWFR